MGEKIVVGPINKGLRNDRTPFVIDNDAFPVLINAYQWRGRVKRKRGTSLLGRLQRFFNSDNVSYDPPGGSVPYTITLDGLGKGNLLIGPYSNGTSTFALQSIGNIVPGSVVLLDTVSSITYTDPAKDGTLSPSGTINYSTGAIVIAAAAGHTIQAQFLYFPDLPVMGLEDFVSTSTQFPNTIGFDTTYSYWIQNTVPYDIYDVSFYKNPIADGVNLPGYVPKTNVTPLTWNGADYQQFFTVNYQGSMWTTNGITVPFTTTNIGMQFAPANTISAVSQTATSITMTITNCPLVIGDFVFLNEWTSATPANASTLNFQSGYVTACSPNTPGNATKTVTITLPFAAVATDTYTPGIVQYLTTRVNQTEDCLRWFDGDPTNGSATNPVLNGRLGWVNFCPPLSQATYSIADLPSSQYYLVGARLIVPFKDRLLFMGPVVQPSSGSATPVYLQDTIIYSQNGTPYYTSSFSGNPSLATTNFHAILVPTNQTATAPAYWEDQTGFGGFITAGIDQPILTSSPNEDALVVGFSTIQTKLIYSGSNFIPFSFYITNSELGSASTFSTINMDYGVITFGNRGFIITNQTSAQRIDVEVPDEAFEVSLLQNGNERFCAQRDFVNEWIYFTYSWNQNSNRFPTQTLFYNYRDRSWGIFRESYTTYGSFRRQNGYTWATIGLVYPTWASWNEPWNAGDTTLLQPEVIGGNQQGFVLVRDEGTNEGNSLFITNISYPAIITGITQANPAVITANNQFVVGQQVAISGVVGMTNLNGNRYTITAVTPTTLTISVDSTGFPAYISGGVATPLEPVYSPNHCLNRGDFIVINGCLGTVGPSVNGKIFQVGITTTNGFMTNPVITSGTYLGGGLIQRMYVPFIQSKQLPVAWEMARKIRLGPQQYLFTTTATGQVTLLIYLSQNADDPYNEGPIVPANNVMNNTLIYSTLLYTCPESTNLGLTPANVNLNLITAMQQSQTWHRMNTSLLGDTVQFAITMSDIQMTDVDFDNQFAEIEFHGCILDVSPSQMLA